MQTINNKQTCALCQFYDWLIRRNIRVIDSWLLLSLPAGGGGSASSVAVAKTQPRPSILRHLGVTGGWCKVTVSFLLPPLNPSSIVDDCERPPVDGNSLWSS